MNTVQHLNPIEFLISLDFHWNHTIAYKVSFIVNSIGNEEINSQNVNMALKMHFDTPMSLKVIWSSAKPTFSVTQKAEQWRILKLQETDNLEKKPERKQNVNNS